VNYSVNHVNLAGNSFLFEALAEFKTAATANSTGA